MHFRVLSDNPTDAAALYPGIRVLLLSTSFELLRRRPMRVKSLSLVSTIFLATALVLGGCKSSTPATPPADSSPAVPSTAPATPEAAPVASRPATSTPPAAPTPAPMAAPAAAPP